VGRMASPPAFGTDFGTTTMTETNPSTYERRDVIKAGAMATAALAVGNAFAQEKQAEPAQPKPKLPPIKVGLLGCGGRGTGAAFDALQADSGVVIHAIGDILGDRVKSCRTNLETSVEYKDRVKIDDREFIGFEALDRMLATDIEVILLATPPAFRPTQVVKSIDAGKHVFAEKPFGVDVPGALQIQAAGLKAKEKNLSLMSGFCWRSSLPERAVYEQIHKGAIGNIRTIYATYNGSPNASFARKDGQTDMEWQVRNWFHFLWLGGDHIVEQACHSVDKLNWAMNNQTPLRCWAVGGRAQRADGVGNIYDHFGVTYEYKGGVRSFLQARQWENCPTDNTDYVYGEKGTAFINGWGPSHVIKGESANWVYDGPSKNMYVHEHEEMFAGIRSGKVRNDTEWAVQSTLMAIMGRMAAYTGEVITWEKLLTSTEVLGPAVPAMGEVAVTPVPRPGYTKFS